MPALAHLRPDHDETLIARLAAGDVNGPEAAAATQLVAVCPACAELHADLRSIIAATATLPAPRRTRDFRLTEADAARLRPAGWRRLLGRFGDPRAAFTRPLATGLVTLGLAGLLLSVAPSLLPSLESSAAAAPVAGAVDTTGGTPIAPSQGTTTGIFGSQGDANAGDGLTSQGSPAASGAPASAASAPNPPVAAASVADLGNGVGGVKLLPSNAPILEENPGVGKSTDAGAAQSAAPSPLLLVSIAFVIVGVALFALRWVARRTA